MNIGLETTWINVPDGGGRYTNEVLRHLCRRFPGHTFFALGPRPVQVHDYSNLVHIPFSDTLGLKARFTYAAYAARVLRRFDLDVYHNLVNFGIYNASCPMVTTIHDLLTLKYPELRSRSLVHGFLYKYYIPILVRKADRIIVDSESARRDVVELYKPRCPVATVHLGYNTSLFSPQASSDDTILARYGLEPGYLFFVGNLIPKKNVRVLVNALSILKKRGKLRLRLVLAGKRGHGSDDIFHLVESLSLSGSVTELGWVPDEDLGSLYRGAGLFLFPSFYEGFGLPVIEAMGCGTPVLVSNAGPLPELVEDMRYTCDPSMAEDWAAKIELLLDDKTAYTEAKQWSLERAAHFSWEQCVDRYMTIYSEIAE